MARQPRIDLPYVAQHVVQRGNDRRPCFFQPTDHVRTLDDLRDLARRVGCAVHAYVLMTNQAHLLLTPSETGQVGPLIQALGRRYVRYINDRYHRTGTLWEGRYKACPVDTDTYLLRCHRYIELNPVRAAMIPDPASYRWSSYAANARGERDPLLTPHPVYLALGADATTRQQAYRAMVAEAVTAEELELIRLRLQRQHALGSERFRCDDRGSTGSTRRTGEDRAAAKGSARVGARARKCTLDWPGFHRHLRMGTTREVFGWQGSGSPRSSSGKRFVCWNAATSR